MEWICFIRIIYGYMDVIKWKSWDFCCTMVFLLHPHRFATLSSQLIPRPHSIGWGLVTGSP
jgi:hypothetical protein